MPIEAISCAGGPEADHPAVVDDGDPIAEPFGLLHVMRRQDNRPPRSLELLDEIPELAAGLRIESGGRLVEKQEVGIADQGNRQGEALFLPARQRHDARVALFLELDQGNQFVGRRTSSVEAAEEPQRLDDRQLVGELGVLQLDAEPLAQLLGIRGPAQAEDLDVASVRHGEPLADLDRRRLAGAVRAQQPEALAGGDVEVDAVDGNDLLVSLAKITDPQRLRRPGRHPNSMARAGNL